MNVKSLISVTKPYTSSIDFEIKNPATISWASIGEVDTVTAREFAIELLRQVDALDYSRLEIAPYEYWSEELLFEEAKLYCFSLNIDGKIGWRFPTLQECDMIRKQADSNLFRRLSEKNWVYTSTEPFEDIDGYNTIRSRPYEYSNDGPVTTYGFSDDEYDFEQLDDLRATVPVRTR
jgi:hypothetical protein